MIGLSGILQKYFPAENPAIAFDRLNRLIDDLYNMTGCFDDLALKSELQFLADSSKLLDKKIYDLEEYSNYKELKALEDKYSEFVCTLALRHIIETGRRIFENREKVEEAKEKIKQGNAPSRDLTPDAWCRVFDCAADISQVNLDNLLKFIKTDMSC